MASSHARLLFLVFLILHCLIWSHSRYGQLETSVLQGDSLVKRISYELLNPGIQSEGVCRPIAEPIASQCIHVRETCASSRTFLSLNYLPAYFCTEPAMRPLVFMGLIIWLMFLFSTLGISASDFFTPNLATIAQLLGLDENVAGVTFLAFGNGSPDVFSTFSAMRANSGSLAIGELLGAASFIVSCVVGSMCIIKPFHVHPGPFIRDVLFLIAAVGLLLVILWDGKIRPWESIIMVGLYVTYATVVVIGSWWEARRQRFRAREALVRAEYQEDELPPYTPYRDSFSTDSLAPSTPRPRAISAPSPSPPRLQIPTRSSRTPSPPLSPSYLRNHLPSFSLVGALEFREVVASLRHESASSSLGIFDSPVTPYAGGHYHSYPHSRAHSRSSVRTPVGRENEIDPWDAALGVPLDSRSPPRVLVTPAPPDAPETENIHELTPGAISIADSESMYMPITHKETIARVLLGGATHILFPSLHNFHQQSILGQIASVFAAPAILLLTLTLPVVVTPYNHNIKSENMVSDHNLIDFEEEGIERTLVAEDETEEAMHGIGFNKWLMATQCIFGPLFCVMVLFSGAKLQVWLLLAAAIGGMTMSVLVIMFTDKGDHTSFRMARCLMGFFVAIVWIMAIADEVVQVLQTFGFVFGLSDAIIGLTIFAVGNSLADLVANMSVAVFAPIMGFSACFGGPMLNILLGVGGSGSYIMAKTLVPYELVLGKTLFVSSIGLLFLLCSTLLVVPLNGYYLSRTWGIFLVISYMLIMTINVVVELKL